ncbi:MAG: HAD family hydrolase [Pseudomonadota bacterium]
MITKPAKPTPETILPHQIAQALDRAPEGVKILSLDCFDTLLWRDCHAPVDVFPALEALTPGLALGQRVEAEANARKAMRTLKRRGEVQLADIYAQALPNADNAAREAAIKAELAAEARSCFAFEPTVALMQAAKARGLDVIIVSDTYLSAKQLRALIEASAGPDVAGLIDRVFASSDAGISKGEGLLAKALKAMKCRAHQVLHIGDNFHADHEGARALGIPALHLKQFSEATKQRLRFESTAGQFNAGSMIAAAPGAIASPQPHRAALACHEPQIDRPDEALGFATLGPVFHAYDQWLRREAEALAQARGGTVHWLFMLRDGHLPWLVHQAGGAAPSIGRVEISRYAATAASLTTRAAYDRHVALGHRLNPATLAKQLLMTRQEIAQVIGDPRTDAERAQASATLLKELRKGQRQKLTARRARTMADGMIVHVRAACDPQPGDTLMLVDLGYNGSAQNAIDALLQEELGVHVAGRYLLCRERSATGLDKTGMIDPAHFDAGVLEAMCANVAVIEQLATCELGSVIGYSEAGEPIRKESSVKGKQSQVRDGVQAGVVGFARAMQRNPVIRQRDPQGDLEGNLQSGAGWCSAAAAALTRFMFLPQPAELDVLKSFEHDVNLGSERMVALFDTDHAAAAMKRRGLFYMKGSSRMFLPAELAQEDMSTRLALMAHKRFGLGLTYADCAPRSLSLPVFHVSGEASATSTLEARATHDGFFVARIPLSAEAGAVALHLGPRLEWVEIAEVACVPVATLSKGEREPGDGATPPLTPSLQYDAMREHAPGLYECESENALMLIMPPPLPPEPHMLEIVLRPLRERANVNTAAPMQIKERAA